MIGEGLWKRRFDGERSLLGLNVTLNGVSHTVVGTAPAAPGLLSNGDSGSDALRANAAQNVNRAIHWPLRGCAPEPCSQLTYPYPEDKVPPGLAWPVGVVIVVAPLSLGKEWNKRLKMF